MNNATLEHFRKIAEAMNPNPEATSWAVCRKEETAGRIAVHVVCFGYTKARAERAALNYRGGFAALTDEVLPTSRPHLKEIF